MSRDLKNAVETWKLFHQKRLPSKVVEVSGDRARWPKDWVCVGRCRTIYYNSDKWYDDGSRFNYYHTHGKSVYCWHPLGYKGMENLPKSQIVSGKKFPVKKTHDSLAVLADFIGYDLLSSDGGVIEAETPLCLLCCTPDRKALVAFDEVDGIVCVIAGLDLRVEARGVVG